MKLSLTKKPISARSDSAVTQPEPQPRDAVAEAGQKLLALRESFGGVSTKLGRVDQETKTATGALRAAKAASESELTKMRRSNGIDAAPTQRLAEANAEIPKREEQIANLETELGSLKLVLPPQIVATREVLCGADAVDKKEFTSHLRQAFEVMMRIEERAGEFERLTSRYGGLVQHYKFPSLDDTQYANTGRPPYTGAPTWRLEFNKWRSEHPSLEEAPARKWLDGLKSLVKTIEKLLHI